MDILRGMSRIQTTIGGFVAKAAGHAQPNEPQPRGVIWARYVARTVILFMVLFIFMWWPVDSFDPEGFDAWSTRMEALPEEVWYVVLGVIMSWGTTEAIAARAMTKATNAAGGALTGAGAMYTGDDFMSEGASLDGRFANIQDDDEEFFAQAIQPNPVIDEWRANETK